MGMKRILIAAAVLPLALAACGDDQDTSADPTTTHGATSSATTGESLAGDQAAVMACGTGTVRPALVRRLRRLLGHVDQGRQGEGVA